MVYEPRGPDDAVRTADKWAPIVTGVWPGGTAGKRKETHAAVGQRKARPTKGDWEDYLATQRTCKR